jgi:hypothetical protein
MNEKEKEGKVSKDMAIHIKAIAEELNFKPHFLARSLRSGKSYTLGLVIADISNPFFANIARVVENEAKKFGYTVFYGSSDEDASKSDDLIDVLIDRTVDGFIIVSTENSQPKIKELLEDDIQVTLWNGTEYLPKAGEYKDEWFNKRYPKLYGAESMEETFFDPQFHFYWKGMKFISLEAVIARLISRARPSGYTDLFILNKIGIPINFPIQVPKTSIMQGHTYDYTTKAGQQQLLRTIQFYMKTWHNLDVSIQDIKAKLRF